MLTPKQAAEELCIHPETLRRWEQDGKIKSTKTPGGHRRFLETEVQRIKTQGASRINKAPVLDKYNQELSKTMQAAQIEEWRKEFRSNSLFNLKIVVFIWLVWPQIDLRPEALFVMTCLIFVVSWYPFVAWKLKIPKLRTYAFDPGSRAQKKEALIAQSLFFLALFLPFML